MLSFYHNRNICDRAHEFAQLLFELEDQGNPIQAALRIEASGKHKHDRRGSRRVLEEVRPGTESQPGNGSQIVQLYGYNRSLAGMCSSMARTVSIQIYDRVYHPPQYLLETLRNVRKIVSLLCVIHVFSIMMYL